MHRSGSLLLLFSLVLAPVTEASADGAGDPIPPLAVDLESGSVHRYRLVEQEQLEMGGFPEPFSSTIETDYTLAVTDAKPDGWEILVTFATRAKTVSEELPQPPESLREAVEKLGSVGIHMRLDRHGIVHDPRGMPKIQAPIQPTNEAALLRWAARAREMLSPDGLRAMMQQDFGFELPARPATLEVAAIDEGGRELAFPSPYFGAVTVTTRERFTGIGSRQGRPCARFESDLSFHVTDPGALVKDVLASIQRSGDEASWHTVDEGGSLERCIDLEMGLPLSYERNHKFGVEVLFEIDPTVEPLSVLRLVGDEKVTLEILSTGAASPLTP